MSNNNFSWAKNPDHGELLAMTLEQIAIRLDGIEQRLEDHESTGLHDPWADYDG